MNINTWILHKIINSDNIKYSLKKVEPNIFKRLLFNDLHKKFKFTIK